MGWKLAIAGAVMVVLAALFLGSGDSHVAWLGFALLLVGAVSVPVGLLLHIDRRMRELARQLSELEREVRSLREDARGAGAQDAGSPVEEH